MLKIIKSTFHYFQMNYSGVKENPLTNLVAGVALGIIGTILFNRSSSEIKAKAIQSAAAAVVALIAYKTFALLSDLFDWRYLWRRFFSKLPKDVILFDQLTQFGINRESIERLEEQIKEGDYSSLKSLLLSSDVKVLMKFKSTHFCEWMFPHLKEMLKRDLLTDEECGLIHERFCHARLFECDQSSYRDSRGSVSKIAFLLASPVFRALSETAPLNPSPILLKSFIEQQLIAPSNLRAATEMLTAFRFWQCGEVEKHFFQDQASIQKLFPSHINDSALCKLHSTVNQISTIISDSEINERIKEALFDSYLICQGGKTIFHFEGDLYALPSSLLSKLARTEEVFHEMRDKVNTVVIDLSDVETELGALRVLKATQPQLFQPITSLLLFTYPNTKREVYEQLADLFTEAGDIYLTNYRIEDGAYHIDLNCLDSLREVFDTSFHVIKSTLQNVETRVVVDNIALLDFLSPFEREGYKLYAKSEEKVFDEFEFDSWCSIPLPGFEGFYTEAAFPDLGEALADDFVEEDAG